MKRYIKTTFFTLFENFLLSLFLLFVLFKLGWKNFPLSFFPILYITLLITLLLLKKLRIQWRRFRILHFSIHKIDQMSGEAFEAYLYEQFVRLGFKVTTTNVSGDYGADLILQKKKLVIALQAKRYQGKIGVKAIQEVLGSMAYYEADKGLVVTNSTYTRNAEKLAEVNHVLLWDRDVLIRLIAGENMSTYLSELLKNDF